MTNTNAAIGPSGRTGNEHTPSDASDHSIDGPVLDAFRSLSRKISIWRCRIGTLREKSETMPVPQGRGRCDWLAAVALCAGLLSADAVLPQAAAAETGERLQQCQRQEASCRQEVEGLRQGAADLQRCRSELEVCTAKLAKTFLAIVIQWPTVRHDVDLHIFDASGREYFWDKKRYSGHSGELSVDTTCGPGVEIWEIADAPVGEYRVYYNLFDRHGNGAPAVVNGGVYHREGHNPFRKTALTNPGTAQLVAKVTVKNDGNVEVSQSSRDVINRPHRDSTECHRPSQRR